MKTKLTLTIENDLIPRAKDYAHRQGASLSALLEKAIRKMTQAEEFTFSKRWRGKFKAAGRSSPRYKTLSERYL